MPEAVVFRKLYLFPCLLAAGAALADPITFRESGTTDYGLWSAEISMSSAKLETGGSLSIQSRLTLSEQHVALLQKRGLKLDGLVVLATAERTFDASGWLRFAGADRMSTLLTPTGLPIEGGVFGAVTNRFGGIYRSPIDVLSRIRMDQTTVNGGMRIATFDLNAAVPDDLPPGIYRIRLDYGFTSGNKLYSLNAEKFAERSVHIADSHHYSPPLRMAGPAVPATVATMIPRIPWVLLASYNSNGYRGVVAEEDQHHFNLAGRNLIQDDVILPRLDQAGQPLAYSLEPQFLADTIEAKNNTPWNFSSGYLSVQVQGPDGVLTDLGTVPFAGKTDAGPTTGNSKFTAWKPPAYGLYKVRATGWIQDVWGNRYAGGGVYRFWIAKRMTLSTATFQGMAYPVGATYGRDITFAPAAPAEVAITANLFVNSNPKDVVTVTNKGQASASGVFGAAQGMKRLTLSAPGEYNAHILARYTDKLGHLWVCSMRHAGVVYPLDSPVVARGKKVEIDGKSVERGETKTEGDARSLEANGYLATHLNYPYLPGDVILIASEQEGANAISTVLTVEPKANPAPYDQSLAALEATNLQLRTSNGLSPHLFPEFIKEWSYFYAGAPRPGMMARFLVAENGVRSPYWVISPNDFGGQINASKNGDLPGDIYRLIGGVVVRKASVPPAYAGYLASAFILPKRTNNNRVISAGAEDLVGPDGTKARFWLTGTRPGQLFEAGRTFVPAIQVDPILPAQITFTLHYPDGRAEVAKGVADGSGLFVGAKRWTLDAPGRYLYTVEAEWNGHKGRMPGLPPSGGHLYVVESEPAPDAPKLHFNLEPETTFSIENGVAIKGASTAQSVSYSAIIPGAVIDQGELPVKDGQFSYFLNPAELHKKFPTYDTIQLNAFVAELKDVIHLTFFSKETGPGGSAHHSFVRLIVRGNRILYTR